MSLLQPHPGSKVPNLNRTIETFFINSQGPIINTSSIASPKIYSRYANSKLSFLLKLIVFIVNEHENIAGLNLWAGYATD